jgi:hypothetical protein
MMMAFSNAEQENFLLPGLFLGITTVVIGAEGEERKSNASY